MKHEWVLDVLADIKRYSERNGLGELEAQLEETIAVARRDTGAGPGSVRGGAPAEGDGGGTGTIHRRCAAGSNT